MKSTVFLIFSFQKRNPEFDFVFALSSLCFGFEISYYNNIITFAVTRKTIPLIPKFTEFLIHATYIFNFPGSHHKYKCKENV